jgi:hypothetical protein
MLPKEHDDNPTTVRAEKLGHLPQRRLNRLLKTLVGRSDESRRQIGDQGLEGEPVIEIGRHVPRLRHRAKSATVGL